MTNKVNKKDFLSNGAKIAIIADTHDNLATIKKALDWINKNKIKIIIHCGDVCAPSTLKEISQQFPGKIHLVFGNVDGDKYLITKMVADGALPNIVLYNELGEIEIDNKKIAFVHQPKFAQALASTGNYHLVFYGHSHQPWEEKIGNCKLVNPGTLAGLFYKATFAVYDTKEDKLELKILEKL